MTVRGDGQGNGQVIVSIPVAVRTVGLMVSKIDEAENAKKILSVTVAERENDVMSSTNGDGRKED